MGRRGGIGRTARWSIPSRPSCQSSLRIAMNKSQRLGLVVLLIAFAIYVFIRIQ
jgi:hypothetical protein